MTALTTQPAAPNRDEERFNEIYETHFEFLVSVAMHKFRVPESEAETLAHEVFLTYWRKTGSIYDLRAWLVGAICHASRHYWRMNRRPDEIEDELAEERADPASTHILDSLPDQLAARQALECLTPRDQEILRLRYFDGCTVPEIAERLGIKKKYAAKLVAKCLQRAERAFTEGAKSSQNALKGKKK
ncbi:MAG: sigma-70 family RNA polymerase sigma factor [Acidobacteria bacterium]|nr:sigma-70 family RNA polymerase sigma factor [Acidobacteriota bacterium]